MSLKRMPDWTQDDWNKIFQKRNAGGGTSGAPEIEGATYYSYTFVATRASGGNPATLIVHSEGDLDGDGGTSVRLATYQRDGGGIFRPVRGAGLQYPDGWLEEGADDGSF
jgi:hypothetical protein